MESDGVSGISLDGKRVFKMLAVIFAVQRIQLQAGYVSNLSNSA